MSDMPNKIAAWRFSPDKADEWVEGGWSQDHDRKTTEYIRTDHVDALLKAEQHKTIQRVVDAIGGLIDPDSREAALQRLNDLISEVANISAAKVERETENE